jgi:F-box interacting protein
MEPSPLLQYGHDAYADILPPLHKDNVIEIMLRIPAKDLCRLRAVSRSWCSFLSQQQFISDHAARHPEPLIVFGYNTYNPKDRRLYEISDLSGSIVKRVHAAGNEWVLYAQPDLLCIAEWANMSVKLLNPATGVVHVLPIELAEGHEAYEQNIYMYSFTATFGQVAATGVYKVLRVFAIYGGDGRLEQLYEVFTLDGSSHGRWRAKQAPPYQIESNHWDNVVINGIIYCFLYNVDERKRRIGSFNLETEVWSLSIPGPLSSLMDDDDAGFLDAHHMNWPCQLTIGALSGNLVIACHPVTITPSSLELWFLVDFEKGLWVKKYSIKLSVRYLTYLIHPFLVLNDGRIMFVIDTISKGRLLSIYDPVTKTSQDVVVMRYGAAVGLCTGSVLSLANSATVPVSEVSILFSIINIPCFYIDGNNLVPLPLLSYRTQLDLLMAPEIWYVLVPHSVLTQA